MPVLNLSASDVLAALQDLLPTGPVWPREPDAVQTQALATLCPTYVRLTQRDNNLLVDAFPTQTAELLPEWELTLGLPNQCTPPNPTLAQRKAAVAAKVVAQGGQSVPYYIAVAAALGFTITIVEYAPFRAGINAAGQPVYGMDWAHTWTVRTFLNAETYFQAGISGAGDALATWGNSQLECTLNQLKPAHTILQFNYTGQTGLLDSFVLDRDFLA